MKKILTFLLFSFLSFYSTSFAQEVVLDEITPDTAAILAELNSPVDLLAEAHIYESDESMSKGIQNAIIVEVASKDQKLVANVWKKFIKDYGGKTKRSKGGKNEYTTSGTEIVGINGVNPLTVYSNAGTGESGTIALSLWFDMGEEYLESNRKEQYNEAEKMLQKFAHEVKIEQTKEELKSAEKKLKGLGNDQKTLVRQNEGYHKDIATYEKKIEEAKENIVNNVTQQEDTGKKIGLQEMLVEEIDRRLGELRKH